MRAAAPCKSRSSTKAGPVSVAKFKRGQILLHFACHKDYSDLEVVVEASNLLSEVECGH